MSLINLGLVILCLLGSIQLINALDKDKYCDENGKCKVITKHYSEIGCKLVENKDTDSCCAERFDCPDFTALTKDKCHYDGEVYELQSDLPKEKLPHCIGSCKCVPPYSDLKAQFLCNYEFCHEQVASYVSECVFQKALDTCCVVKVECDESIIKDLHRCYLDGREYREGEIIYPFKDQCYNCVCDDKFNNATSFEDNPNCKKYDECNMQLHSFSKFQAGCIPIYHGQKPCCPGDWRCPKSDDVVTPVKKLSDEEETTAISDESDASSDELVCKFGELSFKIGETLVDKCYTCECLIPPMLSCHQDSECFL